MIMTDPLGGRQSIARPLWLLRVSGLFILARLLRQVHLETVLELLRGLHTGWLLGAVVITVPFFLVKSWRWRAILRGLGIEIPSRMALQMYGAGLFVGQITPGQLGEIIRAHFLWRRGYDGVLAAGSVVVDRALDLALLVGVALPGAVLVLGRGQGLLMYAVVVGVAAALFVLRPVQWWRVLSNWLHSFPSVERAAMRIDELLVTLGRAFRTPTTIWAVALASVLALALNILRFYLLLLALGLTLPAGGFIFGVALANLVGLLPITVAGVGTRDAVLLLVFEQAGRPGEGAIAFSLLILLLAYGLNLIWGFLAWLLETK